MVGKILNFAFFSLWVGFTGGIITLLFLVVPLEQYLKDSGHSESSIKIILNILIAVWFAVSLTIALLASVFIKKRIKLILLHLLGTITTAFSFLILIQTNTAIVKHFQGGIVVLEERFEFGPYPDLKTMEELKTRSIDGIVTLLSPLIPFELLLLNKERTNSSKMGLTLIEAPMLPWISSNQESMDKIKSLSTSNGKYYIHCYLGKHRVDLVKTMLMETLDIEDPETIVQIPAKFERGEINRITDKIFIGPMPTRDEWFEYIVRSNTRLVISTLNPEKESHIKWIEDEKKWAEASGINFRIIDIQKENDVKKITDLIRKLKKRTYIHNFLNDKKARLIEKYLKESDLMEN